MRGSEVEAENTKRFTVTCYGKFLYGIENASEEKLYAFFEHPHEHNLPDHWIKDSLDKLEVGQTKSFDWHTNKGKLLTMIPEYHREANIKRLV
jgi:hypothetical protein